MKMDQSEISDVETKTVDVLAGVKHAPGHLRDRLFLV